MKAWLGVLVVATIAAASLTATAGGQGFGGYILTPAMVGQGIYGTRASI
jgi:hypothetical protein